jgi:hypothetical protein
MGLLEYQAMPSLHDVAHDGWLCNVYIYFITAAENSISSQLGSSCQGSRYGIVKGRRYGPSITDEITPAGSLSSSSQPGGPPYWASTLAFGLIGHKRKKGHSHDFLAVIKRSCNSWRLPSLITWPLFFHFSKQNSSDHSSYLRVCCFHSELRYHINASPATTENSNF